MKTVGYDGATLFVLFFLHHKRGQRCQCPSSIVACLQRMQYPDEHELDRAYEEQGTIGALEWCQQQLQQHSDQVFRTDWVSSLLFSSARVDKDKASGLCNALMGSCCSSHEEAFDDTISKRKLDFAKELLYTMEKNEFQPDIVTLSLAYVAGKKLDPTWAGDALDRISDDSGYTLNCKAEVNDDWKQALEEEYQVPILYDGPDFAVVNKPSGAYLVPTPKSREISLEERRMKSGMPLSKLKNSSRGFVHRLDRGTSGCLVVAKNDAAHAEWIARFFLRQVHKTYTCLVYNDNQQLSRLETVPKEGDVDLSIDGRPAKSSYCVLHQYGKLGAKLSIQTHQGRKHQVRIHCSKGLKMPIILDPKYGGEKIMYRLPTDHMKYHRSHGRLCLHAQSLSVPHLQLNVEAPLPSWWGRIESDMTRYIEEDGTNCD